MSEELNELWLAMKSTKYNKAYKEIKNSFYEFDDLNESLKKGLNIIISAMHAETATFWFYDFFESERIFPRASSADTDFTNISLGIGEGIAGAVIEDGSPLMIADCQHDGRWAGKVDKSTSFITKSMICVPLFAPDSPVAFGCIQIINKVDDTLFDDADLDFATSLIKEFSNAFIKKYKGKIIGIEKFQALLMPNFEQALLKPSMEKMLETAEKSILECGYSQKETLKILKHLGKIYNILHN